MFINNVSSDGNHVDGLGSVFSFKLISYALSQIYRLKFINNPLKNILGAEFLQISNSEYDSKLNEYSIFFSETLRSWSKFLGTEKISAF